MSEVVYSSEDLTVYGGPSTINVAIDIGPQGIRGSRIYAVTADPRTLPTSQLPPDLIPTDLGINITPSSPDYLTVYQKVGSLPQEWEALYSIFPNVYSIKSSVTFTDGVALTSIPITEVFTIADANYSLNRFTVQVDVESSLDGDGNPRLGVSGYSLYIEPNASNIPILYVKITASEFNGVTFAPISGVRQVHLFSTVV